MSDPRYEKIMSVVKSIRIDRTKLRVPDLKIGDLVSRLPIVQGGMGVGISLSSLASAVAGSGGMGTIAANGIGLLEPDYFADGRAANIRALRREIRKAREAGSGPVGVNIMVALQDFQELLATAIEEKVDFVVMGAGLPVKNIPVAQLREQGVKALPIVSGARAAELIFKMWKRIYGDVPDAVVVEGPEAGGHLGVSETELDDPAHSLEKTVPEVKAAVSQYEEEFNRPIPVIAGGGIFTGEDIYKIMQLGADAVQMGTRFVATDECDADPAFKQAYVEAKKEDIGIIKSPVGLPGRAIVNDFLSQAAIKKRTFKCPWQCLAGCQADKAHYCISLALNSARQGKLAKGFAFAGSQAWRIDKIVPVGELLKELEAGYLRAMLADAKTLGTEVVEKIDTLKKEYRALEQRLGEKKRAYEQALSLGFEGAKKGCLNTVQEEYRKTAALFAEVQQKLSSDFFGPLTELVLG